VVEARADDVSRKSLFTISRHRTQRQRCTPLLVIPAQAGGALSTDEGLVIQSPYGLSGRGRYWIPACAGMTSKSGTTHNSVSSKSKGAPH
jgi:hypothetical protein